ncbi:MAG: phosphatase PAP2 family protein [Acidobacteriota bacterium]|nr:phosphatase PAP2 family protein [Acidobacteriota bacterium]
MPAPPSNDAAAGELRAVREYLAASNPVAREQIAFWDAGSPAFRWIQITIQELNRRSLATPLATRALALVSVAMFDATVAAWDSKYAYNRARPSEADPRIRPSASNGGSPSYPSEHAVAAGAASAVLSALFPDGADTFTGLAEEAARSRLFAGTQFPSDTAAGLQLGRAVGALVVNYGQSDRSGTPFTGSFPPTPGKWSGANPVSPLAGTWKPWALSSGDQFRLDAPPAFDSPTEAALVAEVKGFERTLATNRIAYFWQASFTNPWIDTLNQQLSDSRLDANAPRASRAYALLAIAQHDAAIACWDTKYTYLAPRPPQVDPSVTTLFPLPMHPSFPSGHACASGSMSTVLDYLFPTQNQFFTEQSFDDRATEAGLSTFYSGIHFRNDVESGLAQGRSVAQVVIDRASKDGSQ